MRCELRQGRWQAALADVGEVDAVVVDAPYSARTHGGHCDGVALAKTNYMRACGQPDYNYNRRAIEYDRMTADDVRAFVAHWSPRCRGWFATLTDDVLFPVWREALADTGRCTFSTVPCVITGMTVRLAGDGPSSWATMLCVARPRSRAFASWGTLPGAYVVPAEKTVAVGGKPLTLMRQIIRDYTRPGDLVVDACAGGGTTLIAAYQMGRHSVGAELDPATYAKATARIAAATRQPDLWHGTGERVRVRDAEGGLL
ncbi:MAG: site-specific DNA-methyltransferase [Deltaproteobacteria bacterium]|nr:site-specific DNA-methyltransferase [Deltaproteobacteria bacterium]